MPYPLHRCPVFSNVCAVVDGFLLKLQRLPGGYAFWYGLDGKGKQSRAAVRRRLLCDVLNAVMPAALQRVMLLACYEPSGHVAEQARPLYAWLLAHVYNGDAKKMIQQWLQLAHGNLP